MKKFLGILFLSLLFCSNGFAGKEVNLPKDVVSGSKFKKSLTGSIIKNMECKSLIRKTAIPCEWGKNQ